MDKFDKNNLYKGDVVKKKKEKKKFSVVKKGGFLKGMTS